MKKKRKPQDTTLRNNRALHKRIDKVEAQLAALAILIKFSCEGLAEAMDIKRVFKK